MRFSLKIWACIVVEFVPHLLNKDQKVMWMSVKSLSTMKMLMKTFERTSSLLMKLWFMAEVLKQKPSLCNGCQKRNPDPKKHGKFGPS